jgi:hypothetical protein
MTRFLFAILLLLAASPAAAQEGRWAVRAGCQTLILLEIERTPGAGGWTGRMIRPDHFSILTGGNAQPLVFSEVSGPTVTRRIIAVAQTPRGLELSVEGRQAGDSDQFLFRPGPAGTARLSFTGLEEAALPLVQAAAGDAVAAVWTPGRSYLAETTWPTNAEMTAIFDADQADREAGVSAAIDWSVVTPRDEARRARVRALLDAGALASGDDFYHAAFVFQHGSEPGDYLLAHSFALIAAARGRPDATWIAAATLDRYLQAIGQRQISGTQYSTPRGRPATQDPYDRALISDALRAALGVPNQADQERRRAEFEARARAAEAASPH